MIRQIIKILVPSPIRKYFHRSFYVGLYNLWKIRRKQRTALLSFRSKDTIRCCFFALFEEVWKYDGVFQLMQKNSRFEPVILICPVVNYGFENMLLRMRQCERFFRSKGYDPILSYNPDTKQYVDVMNEIKPDIIFYTNPYKGLIDDRYYIDNFQEVLTIYVPYSINNSNAFYSNFGMPFYNFLWRYYQPTGMHKNYAKKYSDNRGVNAVTVGYPGIESLIFNIHTVNKKIWKNDNPKLKKIIWAPHHTIEPAGSVFYSCFLRYSDFMLDMVQKYQDTIQFAFKPHPLLKNKLELFWGKEKTDTYYNKWQNMANSCVVEGEYSDLFLSSDAMIHDSGSFISEYLYVNKPVMRTLNEVDESEKQNDFSMQCISNHYLANNEQDIEQFIENLINGVDPLKPQRTKFLNEVLMPTGSPSFNIVEDILFSIDNQILYRNQ